MKKKLEKKIYRISEILFFIVLLLFTAFSSYSFFKYQKIIQSLQATKVDFKNFPKAKFEYAKPLPFELNILPSDFSDYVNKYNLDIKREHIVSFLNTGSFFYPKDTYPKNIDLFNEYSELANINNEIFLSSNILNMYFENQYTNITEGSKNLEREGREIEADVNIEIEKDSEVLNYLSNHLTYLKSLNKEYESLENQVKALLNYSEGNNQDILNIIKNLPTIELKENQEYGYLISLHNNQLVISPYIAEENDFVIDNENFSKGYDIEPTTQLAGSIRIPVLMFHQIAYIPNTESTFKQGLYIIPEVFEQQIAYLTKKNYRSISTEEFFNILKTGKNPTQKTIVLTFDDSVENHFTTAYPILKKYGQTGVFFVVSHRSSITAEQLKEMSNNGMDIESHTSMHPDLTKLTSDSELTSEIAGSRSALSSITGKSVNAIAYPGCVANTNVYSKVQGSGYLTGFSCGRKIDHYYINRFSISRTHVSNSLESLKIILSGRY